MLNLPPFFLILLASSAAGSVAAAEPLAEAAGAPAGLSSAASPAEALISESRGGTIEIEGVTGESEMSQDLEEGITYFRRGVVVRYPGMEMVANQVAMSESTGDIIADGNVRLQRDGQLWTGEHLEYNYKTGQVRGEDFRAGLAPFYTQGLKLEADIETKNSQAGPTSFTTDDVKDPSFKIRAKRFKVINGERIEAQQATVYLGDTPVMVLPKYTRQLRQHRAFWRMTPGYRSQFGPYLLNTYHFPVGTNVLGGVKLDFYQRRGVGVGPDFSWNFPRGGEGNAQFYFIRDDEPRTDANDQPIRDDRHRISFSHRATLRTNLTAKVVVREQTDAQMVRDFFETEYRKNSQPASFLELNQAWSNWSLNLLARPQLNEFFQTVERLPDVRLTGLRQQLGATPLYYESETSAAYLRFEPGAVPPGLPPMENYAAMRADSFHQVLLPQNYFGWLNFVPRVGGRITQYGETEGVGTTFDDRSRFVFNTGAEVSTKASRVFRGVRSKFWELNELRHILEPSVNYVFVPEPNYTPDELPQFDREIPSLRLLPNEFPDYNAVDSVDSRNVLRFSLWNKLQTKREGEEGPRVENVVGWGLYTDWRLNPDTGQTTFSDIYSDLDLRPRSWLSFSSETRWEVKNQQFNAAYHTVTVSPNSSWSWRGGHRYFEGGPEFGPDSDHNTVFSSLYLKFNENWAARFTHHFEARDGTLEEQYYTLYRDFRSWTGALTLRLRDQRTRSSDFTIAFAFQLKAFPRFRLKDDLNEHSFLLGS